MMIWLCIIGFILFILLCFLIYYYQKKKYPLESYSNMFKDPNKWFWEFESFLSPNECDEIINAASKKGLNRSQVKDFKVENNYRKSDTCWLSSSIPIVKQIYNRLEKLLQIKQNHFEMMQVVRYNGNGYFKWHYDQCDENEEWCKKEIEKYNGYRLFTALIYLNDDYIGGETEFKYLPNQKKFKKGTMVIFRNVDKNSIEKKSYHQGKPLKSGTKWICNIWVRGRFDDNIFDEMK